MVDGYGGDATLLNDREVVLGSLEELVGKLEMEKLGEPVIYRAEPNGIKDPGGWSGFVVIMESHISIHTFPGRCFLSADVYTCKNGLNEEDVKSYIMEKFKLKDLEVNFVKRGTKYPSEDLI